MGVNITATPPKPRSLARFRVSATSEAVSSACVIAVAAEAPSSPGQTVGGRRGEATADGDGKSDGDSRGDKDGDG